MRLSKALLEFAALAGANNWWFWACLVGYWII